MAFPLKYTPEQRAAIAGAVLDDGLTVAAAVRAAALGELGPAFTITPGAAYSIVAKERQDRPSLVTSEDLGRRLLALCARELNRLEGMPELGPADVRASHGVAKLARLASPLVDSSASAPPSDDDAEGEDEAPPSLAARIAARAQGPELAEKVRASRANGHAAPTP